MGCIVQCSNYTVKHLSKLFLRPLSHSSRQRRASKDREPADLDWLTRRAAASGQPVGIRAPAHTERGGISSSLSRTHLAPPRSMSLSF